MTLSDGYIYFRGQLGSSRIETEKHNMGSGGLHLLPINADIFIRGTKTEKQGTVALLGQG